MAIRLESALTTGATAMTSAAQGSALFAYEAPVVRTGVSRDWKAMLPVLRGAGVSLRPLRSSDAPSLLAMLSTEEVARFVSPPPTTVAGFERFITWADDMRRMGTYACFAVVPHGLDVAVGIFQVRALDVRFGVAEWGFAIGSPYWGTGLFMAGAELTVDFAVDVIGVERLEARAVTLNGRGNGGLTKLGAVREATLRQSFSKDARHFDQYLWSILATDWRERRAQFERGASRRLVA